MRGTVTVNAAAAARTQLVTELAARVGVADGPRVRSQPRRAAAAQQAGGPPAEFLVIT